MADQGDHLAWLLGPADPTPIDGHEGGFASWLVQTIPQASSDSTEVHDEWSALGLTGLALATAREWSIDLAAAQLPDAPRVLRLAAPKLRQLLAEVQVNPSAFQERAGRAERGT